jgi:hypothetical protein
LEAALCNAAQALRFSPGDPLAPMFHTVQAFSRLALDEPRAAEALARRAIDLQPRAIWSRLALTCALVEMGELEQARDVIADTRRVLPTRPVRASVRSARTSPRQYATASWRPCSGQD